MFKTIRSLWQLMKGSRFLYIAAIGAIIVASLFAFVIPRVFQMVIDYAIDDKPLAAPQWLHDAILAIGVRSFWQQNLWIASLVVVALAVLNALFSYLHGRWAGVASERVARRLRNRLYNHMQHLPCRYHDEHETGDLVQRCTSDVETIRMFMAMQITEIGRSIIMLVMGLCFMIPISGWMTLASTVLLPFVVIFAVFFFMKVKNTFKQADESEGRMTAMLQENLTAIRVVRAFARQEHEQNRFAERNADYRNRWYRLVQILSIYWSGSDLLCMAQSGLVLAVGAYMVVHDASFSVGDLLAFTMYVNMFLWPIRHMGRVLADMGKAIVSLGRINEILHAEEEPETPDVLPSPAQCHGGIAFAGVTFSHTGEEHALRDVSFTVDPGQTLAIVGPSGAGKSTIISLLLRLYDFETGSICLDGTDIRRLDRKWVRSRIGAVLQEPFLYSRSLRENIKLGRSSANQQELEQAVEAAGLMESVRRFEDGYDTLVGERGVTLSGGQRQRVALARAILQKPPILILDDALSAVDTRTERMILDALSDRAGKNTTIVIAHRISTLMHADRTIVLHGGRIVQEGTHRQLIQQDGLYKRLWQIQTSLEEDLQAELNRPAPCGGTCDCEVSS